MSYCAETRYLGTRTVTISTYVWEAVTVTKTGTVTLPAGYEYIQNVWVTVWTTKYGELGVITQTRYTTVPRTNYKTVSVDKYSTIYTTKYVPKTVGVATEVITKQLAGVVPL
jgi:hypothetical protein